MRSLWVASWVLWRVISWRMTSRGGKSFHSSASLADSPLTVSDRWVVTNLSLLACLQNVNTSIRNVSHKFKDRHVEIKPSDWMVQVTWLLLINQSAFSQHSLVRLRLAKLKFVYYIGAISVYQIIQQNSRYHKDRSFMWRFGCGLMVSMPSRISGNQSYNPTF